MIELLQMARASTCWRPRWPAWLMAAGLLLGMACARSGGERGAAPLSAGEGPVFEDVALEAGVGFTYFTGRSGRFHTTEITGAGVGVLDYDGDGLLDLYFPQGSMLGGVPLEMASAPPPAAMLPLTDRLYRNESAPGADGRLVLRFRDVTEEAGISELGYGMGVAAGDFDNDGDVDLYVTNVGPNSLWRNRGDRTFERIEDAGGAADDMWSVPAVFFDVENDGWLDLFVGNYVEWNPDDLKRCFRVTGSADYCGPLAYREAADRLYRNVGGADFVDRSQEAGLSTVFGSALGAVAFDADGDHRLDLYVSNDGRPNQLWINRGGGVFADEAPIRGAAVNAAGYAEAGMGVEAADFDGDGSLDIFLAHLKGETNTLYRGDAAGMFDDRSTPSGLAVPSKWATAFGAVAIDYDNDGWLDIYTANGEVRVIEEQARDGATGFPLRQRNQLFHNQGQGQFVEVSETAGPPFERLAVSRGVAIGDLDNDGDSDLVVLNAESEAEILVNLRGQEAQWIGLRVVDPALRRDAFGARVEVMREQAPRLVRRVGTDGSYASARDPRVLVGLGEDGGEQRVRVTWPGGAVEEWSGLATRRYHLLERGGGSAVEEVR